MSELRVEALTHIYSAGTPFQKTAVENIEGVKVICGRKLVPEQRELFGDLTLHPADKGFDYYTENLINELKKIGY